MMRFKLRWLIVLASLLCNMHAIAQTGNTYPYQANALQTIDKVLSDWRNKLLEFYPYNSKLFKKSDVESDHVSQDLPQPPSEKTAAKQSDSVQTNQAVATPNVSGFGEDDEDDAASNSPSDSASDNNNNVSGF